MENDSEDSTEMGEEIMETSQVEPFSTHSSLSSSPGKDITELKPLNPGEKILSPEGEPVYPYSPRPLSESRKLKEGEGYPYYVMDTLSDVKFSKGTEKLKQTFSPLLQLFGVIPSGNVFKDFGLLAEKLEDENYFLSKIFEKIFELYDFDRNGAIDSAEMKELLMDVGEALGDDILRNISESHLSKILYLIDANGNGIIEKEELITYLCQWVNETEREEDEEDNTGWHIPSYNAIQRSKSRKQEDQE